MKYYLIAGEASGDLHGSNLMKEIRIVDKDADFRFFGGDLMQAIDGTLVKHYREMAFMGLFEVLANLQTIKNNFKVCKSDILNYKPDVLILIDYPGFNLRMAEFAKKNGIKVFYYISPKIWAWKEGRIKKIKAFVDEMFTILPFETQFFAKHNFDVHYVGNPLVEGIREHKKGAISETEFRGKNKLDKRPIVSLVAGSRMQEIKLMLPVMAQLEQFYPEFQFVISGAPSIPKDYYKSILGGKNIPIAFDQSYDLLLHSYASVVTSGTASLETALFKIPQVVIYTIKGNKLFLKLIRKFLIKVKYVSLPNLILNTEAIKEYIAHEMTIDNIAPELGRLLNDSKYRAKIFEDYNRLEKLMGEPGAAKRAAEKMYKLLKDY